MKRGSTMPSSWILLRTLNILKSELKFVTLFVLIAVKTETRVFTKVKSSTTIILLTLINLIKLN